MKRILLLTLALVALPAWADIEILPNGQAVYVQPKTKVLNVSGMDRDIQQLQIAFVKLERKVNELELCQAKIGLVQVGQCGQGTYCGDRGFHPNAHQIKWNNAPATEVIKAWESVKLYHETPTDQKGDGE